MKIETKDKVKVITGKDKGKEGVVSKVLKRQGKIVVEGVNIAKRHVKPGSVSKEGGILNIEKPIDVSNVMLLCSKCNNPVRVGYVIDKGKKYRICKNCGEVLTRK